MNVLDDSLSPDLAEAGAITSALTERFQILTRYAQACGAKGVLFTCSAFGAAIEAAAAGAAVPTLKPNEAMFEEALQSCAQLGRAGRIGMVSTFAPSVPGMRQELDALAQRRAVAYSLQVECPDGALQALSEGRTEVHDALVSQAAQKLRDCDVLMLGQFSTSHMKDRVSAETGRPVLSSPDSAVTLMRRAVGARSATNDSPTTTRN